MEQSPEQVYRGGADCALTGAAGPLGQEPRPAEGATPLRPLRILHLEDSPSDSELAREHLDSEEIPAVLRRIETREQFQAALEQGDVDLIIADFQLPAFDGISAFLLARELRPEIPFIMLTGKLGEEYAIDTLKLGVTDYVLKQSLTRLAPAVHRALVQRQERAQRRDAQEQLSRHREHLEELVRQRTAELEERNGQLALANRDLETFAAAATHDLRTPLVVIGGFAQRLMRHCAGRIEPRELEWLQGIVDAGTRMEHLLDDLNAFFRASHVAPNRVPVEMEALVRAAFSDLGPLGDGRRVSLSISPLPEAFGDPAMIRQVMVNLLANAVKYTAARESAVIDVSGWEGPDVTGYCVQDNGIGFDDGFREKVFELFERLHDTREYPGTGVGLATVKRIVEKHGGRIWVNSSVDQGANFCFTLPRSTARPVN
jgi:signal transduction histidine kinase